MKTISVLLAIITIGYFIPMAVAFCRGKRDRWAIFVVNLTFGWTFIGWVVALVWAMKHDPEYSFGHSVQKGS